MPISNEELELYFSERQHIRVLPFDARACRTAKTRALNRTYFTQVYLPSAIAPDILEENGRTEAEQMASLKFTDPSFDAQPTNMGILVLSGDPQTHIPGAYIQFVRFQGPTRTDPIVDELVITGRIDQQVSACENKFIAHNFVSIDIQSGPLEVRTITYPLVAFQQILRNALMHRTYEGTNAPIRVSWFSDRIEILSPGGTYGLVTPENLGEPGITDYRNPNLAEAMRNLKLAQRFGVGILTAKQALIANGNPPLEFSSDAQFTRFTLRARPPQT